MSVLDKKIDYFVDVVETGSFSSAAKKRYLSQSAMSQQIANLESELGTKLFDRSGYRPALTHQGEIFYHGCLDLKRRVEDILSEMQNYAPHQIRIGLTGSFENQKLLRELSGFKQRHPNVKLSYTKGNFVKVREELQNRNVDVSFSIDSEFRDREGLVYEALYEYQICVICSFDHPFAQKDEVDVLQIKNEPLVVLSRKHGRQFYKNFMDACKKDGLIPRIKKEVDSFDELVFNVSIGEGIGIVAPDVVRQNEIKVLPLRNTHHKSYYAIAYHITEDNPVILEFVSDILEAFKHYKNNL